MSLAFHTTSAKTRTIVPMYRDANATYCQTVIANAKRIIININQ